MHVSHCHISWAQNKLSRRCRRLLQALPQTSHTTWLISLWLSETLGFRSPCCQKHVMYLLQTSFLLRVREDLSQIIALHGGWLLAALIQSDYQRMGWFDIIYFVLMVYNPLPAALPRHCYCWKARRFNQWWVNPRSSILLKQKRLFVWKWSWIGPHLFLRQTSHCYFLLTSANLSKYCNNKEYLQLVWFWVNL